MGQAWTALPLGTVVSSIHYKKLETRGPDEMFFSTSVIKKTSHRALIRGRGRGTTNVYLTKALYFLEGRRITMGKVAAQ